MTILIVPFTKPILAQALQLVKIQDKLMRYGTDIHIYRTFDLHELLYLQRKAKKSVCLKKV